MSYYPLRYERILVHNWLPPCCQVDKISDDKLSSLLLLFTFHMDLPSDSAPWHNLLESKKTTLQCHVWCVQSLSMMITSQWCVHYPGKHWSSRQYFLNLKRVADRQFSRLRGGECRWISCLFCLLSNKIRVGRRPVVINIIENIKRESLGHQDITSWSVIGV